MIGSIIFILIVAGVVAYLTIGVQKNKKAKAAIEAIQSKVEELKPEIEAAVKVVESKVKELKPKAAAKPKSAAKSKIAVTKQKTK